MVDTSLYSSVHGPRSRNDGCLPSQRRTVSWTGDPQSQSGQRVPVLGNDKARGAILRRCGLLFRVRWRLTD
jgi:hypothetical protein